MPGDFDEVRGLVRQASAWLRASKGTDQWASPWPDRTGQKERILNDLLKGKTWLVWDGTIATATITVDTQEPLDSNEHQVWPAHKRPEPALYVRRVVVSRSYAGLGLGAALLDWAATTARRDHEIALIRIDVWTTNLDLHSYYERQGFTRCAGRDPRELANYPAQALFEREVDGPRSDYTKLFTEDEGQCERKFHRQSHLRLPSNAAYGTHLSGSATHSVIFAGRTKSPLRDARPGRGSARSGRTSH
jgi:GNAT superfamily N-acetyltransferase